MASRHWCLLAPQGSRRPRAAGGEEKASRSRREKIKEEIFSTVEFFPLSLPSPSGERKKGKEEEKHLPKHSSVRGQLLESLPNRMATPEALTALAQQLATFQAATTQELTELRGRVLSLETAHVQTSTDPQQTVGQVQALTDGAAAAAADPNYQGLQAQLHLLAQTGLVQVPAALSKLAKAPEKQVTPSQQTPSLTRVLRSLGLLTTPTSVTQRGGGLSPLTSWGSTERS